MTARMQTKAGIARFAPTLLAAAALGLSVPSAVLALGNADEGAASFASGGLGIFTPATMDPNLARRVAERFGTSSDAMRFTPAGPANPHERTVTVAVRIDDQMARAISVRSAIDGTVSEGGKGAGILAIAPSKYNLGVSRGYQSFAKPVSVVGKVRELDMPDLSAFEPSKGTATEKPSRFQPRIAFEQDSAVGRSQRTLESLGEQRVDVGGAYRVSRNLDVTAGVRVSQDRDRLAPLTDGVQDSQAVYVGTQLRF